MSSIPANITVTNEDILKAERHFNLSFNEDQKEVIKCLKTVDVQACPGSGKTTTLAAKLLILCDKIPLTFHRGICVITHTNVAINEIKAKLGDASARLFKYPNHFGTIQSFVDKFLTIPAYAAEFKKRPERIDDETYFKQLDNKFDSTYSYRNAKFSLSKKMIEPYHLRFSCLDFSIVKSIYGDIIGLKEATPTMINAKLCKIEVLEDGYIGFEDAYSLAFRYLRSFPAIKKLFSSRFGYVFIDEMQDMDIFQANILAEVFDINSHEICIQRIGDINQAIFTSRSKTEDSYWEPKNKLEIKTSVRLSSSIAQRVHNVCISPQSLGGREDVQQIKPVIIGFDEKTNISSVKHKFAELIISNGIHESNNVFKAIGLKKDHGKALDGKGNLKLSIKDYFDDYNHLHAVKKSDFNSFAEFLVSPHKSIREIQDNLYAAIIKLLRLSAIKDSQSERFFTVSTLKKYMTEFHPEIYGEIRIRMVDWLRKLMKDHSIIDEIIEHMQNNFCKPWESEMRKEGSEFLVAPLLPFDQKSAPAKLSTDNRFLFEVGETKVPIQFNTIHSIKGETHCATLYLETYNRAFDIEKVIPFILGEERQSARNKNIGRLKTSYVAMTRPTHLLCIAVRANVIKDHVDGLKNCGWEVTILP